jgi:hypothetical protein
MKTTILAAAAIAAIASTASFAQDFSLNPTYGTISLDAGFLPDPAEVQVIAGGMLDAADIGCDGAIANAPDVRLMWGGGEMTIGANSNVDTTLVVNGPDGEWYCADDVNGLNPAIRFGEAGQYDIWVGIYEGTNAPATLYVTEY